MSKVQQDMERVQRLMARASVLNKASVKPSKEDTNLVSQVSRGTNKDDDEAFIASLQDTPEVSQQMSKVQRDMARVQELLATAQAKHGKN